MSVDALNAIRGALQSPEGSRLGMQPDHFDAVWTKDFPYHSKFVWPPSGTDASLSSLQSQSQEISLTANMDLVVAGDNPATCPVAETLGEIYEEYPQTVPRLFAASTGELRPGFVDKHHQGFSEFMDDIYNSMDGEKSTGWSNCLLKGPKKTWLNNEINRKDLTELAVLRLILRYVAAPYLGQMRPLEMINLGLKSPSILFTKKEAHSSKKALSKTWRQIWACDLVDQVTQLLVHFGQNKNDISAYATGSLKSQAIGMGHHDDGIAHFGKVLDWLGEAGNIDDKDAHGWDLTVCRDAIVLDAERRIFCVALEPDQEHLRPVINRLLFAQAMIGSAHVACIGGSLYESLKFGITDSGNVSTSAQNSPIRQAQVRLAGAKRATSLGDDLLSVGLIIAAMLASFGVRTKDLATEVSKPPEGPHDFTSHRWTKVNGIWKAEFLNLPKMLAHADFRATTKDGVRSLNPDAIAGMLFALRHSADSTKVFIDFLSRMDWWVEGIVAEEFGCDEFF